MDAAVLTAAMVLGIENPYAMNDTDLARVRDKLVEQRELLAFYWSGRADMEQALVSGEVIAAYGWNASYASLLAKGIDVGFMNPAEGILTWVDCTCLIADGPGDEQEAYDYLNASLSAEAGAVLIESFGYGAANRRAFELADAGRIAGLGMQQPERLLENARFFEEWDPETRDKLRLMFDETRAGF
jgi:spermidine/putrescine transport system substrate-binding protein